MAEPRLEAAVFVLRGTDRRSLLRSIEDFRARAAGTRGTPLDRLARESQLALEAGGSRLAVVATSHDDLDAKLQRATRRLGDPAVRQIKDTLGSYYFDEPLHPRGKLAYLFPGEGSQYYGMIGDLCPRFPEVGEWLTWCDTLITRTSSDPRPRSRFMRVGAGVTEADRTAAERELWEFHNAVVSVLMANLALSMLLERIELRPDVVAGHSTGELAALAAAGCFEDPRAQLEQIAGVLQTLEREQAGGASEPALLLAVGTSRKVAEEILERAALEDPASRGQVFLAMDNCPHQIVLVGLARAMGAVEREARSRRLVCETLALDRPYHTPLFESAIEPLRGMYRELDLSRPRIPIYSATTGAPFPTDPEELRDLSLRHWVSRVEFTRMVENLWRDGVRMFVECGPRGNLCSFVEDTLRGREFVAVPANVARRSGPEQLAHMIALLAAHHVPLRFERLHEDREPAPAAARATPASAPRVAALAGYFAAMEQFLDLEREVVTSALRGRAVATPRQTGSAVMQPAATRVASTPGLFERIVEREADRIVVQRRLLLDEDRFASHHTVGGRDVSRVDPGQCGQPVAPMTFTLEMMAQVAAMLCPGKQVVALGGIRLLRWLAYDENPVTVELRARRLPGEKTRVQVEVLDLGPTSGGRPQAAASGIVELADDYPKAPRIDEAPLGDAEPCRFSVERVYVSLFHGPLLQGLESLGRVGPKGIEGTVRVIDRSGLFRSNPHPAFLLDPITLDVVMHPLAAWHLAQADQAGRTLLPYQLDRIEFYGPPPEPGDRLESRGLLIDETSRRFTHEVRVHGAGGLWCRMTGIHYWRFYLPFQGKTGFHGPKELYFLSEELPAALPAAADDACAVVLRTPADLDHPALQLAGARVTLTPRELRDYRGALDFKKRSSSFFRRAAVKDAVRTLWTRRSGERLLMADIETTLDEGERPRAWFRDAARPEPLPLLAVDRIPGAAVALAATRARPGIAAAAAGAEDDAPIRFECAERAAVMALDGAPVRVVDFESSTGEVTVATEAGPFLRVKTVRDRELIVATALAEGTCEDA